MNIKVIKQKKTRINQFLQIASCLKSVASIQRLKIMKEQRLVSKILKTIEPTRRIFDMTKFDSKAELHVIMSCDLKFCKNFIKLLNSHLKNYNFPEKSEIIVFGKESFKVLDAQPKVIKSSGLNLIDDAEALALYIQESDYPQTILHFYSEEDLGFRAINIMNYNRREQKNKSSLSPDANQDYFRFYFAAVIYKFALETGFKEKSNRVVAMSEASENAKSTIKKLDLQVNYLRQSMITLTLI